MSNNRIYVGQRYEPQGRNAGNMFKRAPIFTHVPSEKVDNSPFANYKTNESFSSEATQEDRVNPDTLRSLIKEEIAKLPSPEQNNRKLIHTLQAQITDLKERISQYEKDNNIKLQQSALSLKQELKGEAQRMDKQVEQQITSKLRSFFQKVNYELKKDILKSIEDEFLTFAYGEDLQSRLDDINSHIESINQLMTSQKLPADLLEQKLQQATLAETIEPKLNKIERQMDNVKKHTGQLVSKIKFLEDDLKEEYKNGQRSTDDKIELLREKVKGIDQELQKKVGSMEIQMGSNEGDCSILKDKISELQKYNQEQRSLFLDFNRKLSNSKSIEGSDCSDLSTSIVMNHAALAQRPEKNEYRRSSEPLHKVTEANKKAQESPKKMMYQFDTENHLMDGQGNYILTEDGKPIKLSEQQIQALFESNAIEVVQ